MIMSHAKCVDQLTSTLLCVTLIGLGYRDGGSRGGGRGGYGGGRGGSRGTFDEPQGRWN